MLLLLVFQLSADSIICFMVKQWIYGFLFCMILILSTSQVANISGVLVSCGPERGPRTLLQVEYGGNQVRFNLNI